MRINDWHDDTIADVRLFEHKGNARVSVKLRDARTCMNNHYVEIMGRSLDSLTKAEVFAAIARCFKDLEETERVLKPTPQSVKPNITQEEWLASLDDMTRARMKKILK